MSFRRFFSFVCRQYVLWCVWVVCYWFVDDVAVVHFVRIDPRCLDSFGSSCSSYARGIISLITIVPSTLIHRKPYWMFPWRRMLGMQCHGLYVKRMPSWNQVTLRYACCVHHKGELQSELHLKWTAVWLNAQRSRMTVFETSRICAFHSNDKDLFIHSVKRLTTNSRFCADWKKNLMAKMQYEFHDRIHSVVMIDYQNRLLLFICLWSGNRLRILPRQLSNLLSFYAIFLRWVHCLTCGHHSSAVVCYRLNIFYFYCFLP